MAVYVRPPPSKRLGKSLDHPHEQRALPLAMECDLFRRFASTNRRWLVEKRRIVFNRYFPVSS
jgi:hypothetical protein